MPRSAGCRLATREASRTIDVNQGVTSATDFVSREAVAPAAGRLLYLQVNARDMCAITTAADLQANVRAHGSVQALCIDAAFTVTGVAPDINGQPAFWTDHGSGIAWEYAPDAWAELSLSGIAAGGGKPLPPTAATRALLEKVAARVAYGDTTPLDLRVPALRGASGWLEAVAGRVRRVRRPDVRHRHHGRP